MISRDVPSRYGGSLNVLRKKAHGDLRTGARQIRHAASPQEERAMSIAKMCDRTVSVATPDESVWKVVCAMRDDNVGSVVVVDAARKPIGIVTDRDLVVRVLAPGLDPKRIVVESVMTQCPRTLPRSAASMEALRLMRELGVRRLPVVGVRGELVGIVSVDDLLQQVAEELGSLSLVLAHSVGKARLPVRVGDGRSHAAVQPIARAAGDAEC
jgi:CBS domain-containing protein